MLQEQKANRDPATAHPSIQGRKCSHRVSNDNTAGSSTSLDGTAASNPDSTHSEWSDTPRCRERRKSFHPESVWRDRYRRRAAAAEGTGFLPGRLLPNNPKPSDSQLQLSASFPEPKYGPEAPHARTPKSRRSFASRRRSSSSPESRQYFRHLVFLQGATLRSDEVGVWSR